MNRCQISQDFLQACINFIKTGKGSRKIRLWVTKWNPHLTKDEVLEYQNKPLVAKELIEYVLENEITKFGAPMTSRDSLYQFLKLKYWGIKKTDCDKYLKSLEYYQLSKTRGHKNTRLNKEKKEGATFVLTRGRYGKRMNIGLDLFAVPQNTKHFSGWSGKYKFLYIAVLQYSGYVFAYPMKSKHAHVALTQAKKLWNDCFKLFGKYPSGIVCDDGGEFKGAHQQWIEEEMNISVRITNKATFVEKKIQQLARNIGILRDHFGYGFDESLRLGLEKTNNMWNRKIKNLPSLVTGEDLKTGFKHFNKKLKGRPKLRKQPTFRMRDRCRHLTKYSTDVNQKFYKSYTSGRDPHTAIWSKLVYTVQGKKTKDRMPKYQLSNNKWYWPYELQKIPYGVRKLNVEIPKIKRAPKKKKAPHYGELSDAVWAESLPAEPKKISSEIDTSNIVTKKRVRKSRFSSLKF